MESRKNYCCRSHNLMITDKILDNNEIDQQSRGHWCPECGTFNYFDDKKEYNDPFLLLENKLNIECRYEEHETCKVFSNIFVSPLRYPGGKSKILNILYDNFSLEGKTCFLDLYCGGASVGLSFLFSDLIDRLVLNDTDEGIYSLFNIILKKPYELIEAINETIPTRELFDHYKYMIKHNYVGYSELDAAFGFLLINRCAFSGIWSANPLSSITSRWNPKMLEKRILKIYSYKEKITLYRKDALELLEEMYWDEKTVIFIDPPYIEKGKQLYHCYYDIEDHIKLAGLLRSLTLEYPGCADIVITYDNNKLIHDLYEDITIIKLINRNYSISNK